MQGLTGKGQLTHPTGLRQCCFPNLPWLEVGVGQSDHRSHLLSGPLCMAPVLGTEESKVEKSGQSQQPRGK